MGVGMTKLDLSQKRIGGKSNERWCLFHAMVLGFRFPVQVAPGRGGAARPVDHAQSLKTHLNAIGKPVYHLLGLSLKMRWQVPSRRKSGALFG